MATHYKPNIKIWQKKFLTFDYCNALISLNFLKILIFNVAFGENLLVRKRLRFQMWQKQTNYFS